MSVWYYGMAQWSKEDYGHGVDREVSRVELSSFAVV
jgi:hypothetical protein